MMTFKERAEKVFEAWYNKSYHASKDIEEAFKNGYIQGATKQQQIDVDKACEWLEKYMESLGYIDEWCRKGKDDFKKAMEE